MLKDLPNERGYQVESAWYRSIPLPRGEIRQFKPFYSLRESNQ